MAKLNDKYETVMIFNTKNGDEAVKALVEKFTALIEKHGTLETVEEWGKRRLAYPIQDEVEATTYSPPSPALQSSRQSLTVTTKSPTAFFVP